MDRHDAERAPAARGEDMATLVEFIRDAILDEIPALEELQRRASTAWEQYRDQLAAHPDAMAIPR